MRTAVMAKCQFLACYLFYFPLVDQSLGAAPKTPKVLAEQTLVAGLFLPLQSFKS